MSVSPHPPPQRDCSRSLRQLAACVFGAKGRSCDITSATFASSHGADSFHKPGFKLHAKILHHLFTIVNSGVITAPLWDEAAKGPTAYPNNAVFVHEFVSDLLSRSFPNLRPAQLKVSQMHLALLAAVQVDGSCRLRCLNLPFRPCPVW